MGEIILNTLFGVILIYTAYIDIKTHTINDKVHLLIILLGFLKMNFFVSFVGMIITGFPLFISALLSDNKIGGGDVKLMFAVGFFLGANRGIIALMTGLLLIILYGIFTRKKDALALAPFLGAGSLVSLLI